MISVLSLPMACDKAEATYLGKSEGSDLRFSLLICAASILTNDHGSAHANVSQSGIEFIIYRFLLILQ